ncbi:hypothetical protein ACFWAP_03715 [Streptomyces goshikiensis]|uniref:hypothetical protein n=1 Tax=Streptomyces goshikiensis TaxID=1942 RepID=UPI003666A447
MSAPETQHQPQRCVKCRRVLKKPSPDGLGPKCRRAVRKTTREIQGFKPERVEAARELIEDGGIVPIRGRHVFKTVSSDGTALYLSAREACNCPAGLKALHPCFHRVAAHILAA